jgi:hypothetical protein
MKLLPELIEGFLFEEDSKLLDLDVLLFGL